MSEPIAVASSDQPTEPKRELLTVPEACASLRISRWTFYRLLQRRELETVKIGSARRVPVAAIRNFVDELRRQEGEQS